MKPLFKISILWCALIFSGIVHGAQKDSTQNENPPLSTYQLANRLVNIDYSNKQEVRLLLSYLNRYAGNNTITENEKIFSGEENKVLSKIYESLVKNSFNREKLFDTILNIYKTDKSKLINDSSLTNFLSLYLEIQGNIVNNRSDLKEIKSYHSKISNILDTVIVVNKYIDEDPLQIFKMTDTVDKEEVLKKIIFYDNEKQDMLSQNYKQSEDIKDSILKHAFETETFKKMLSVLSINSSDEIKRSNSDNIIEQTSTEITIQLAQLESTNNPNLSFDLPSEAEMIDAVAVYLATRVKQEAALWFFDEMKRNAELYDLLEVFFPNTIDIIQSEDYFKSPTIGTGWQYALARDFTKMPGNVVNSNWFKETLDKYENGSEILNYLKMSVDLAHFYREKFSYKDIVRQLYLNQDKYISKTDNNLNPLKSSINLLYVLSNEFQMYYKNDTGKWTTRELDFEDLDRMTPEAFTFMISLLNIKYKGLFSNIISSYEASKIKEFKTKYSMWIAKVKLTMNQFNKLVKQINATKQKAEEDTKVYEYYNSWMLFTELLESIDFSDADLFTNKLDANTTYNNGKEYVKMCFQTYEMLDKKNYVGATNQMLSIITKIVEENYKKPVGNKSTYWADSLITKVYSNFFKEEEKTKSSSPQTRTHNVASFTQNEETERIQYELKLGVTKNEKIKKENLNWLRKLQITDSAFYSYCVKLLDSNSSVYEKNTITLYTEFSKKDEFKNLLKNAKGIQKYRLDNNKLYLRVKDPSKSFDNPVIKLKIKLIEIDSSVQENIFYSENKLYKAIHHVKNLSSFLADLSETESSKDIKKIIDAYALPPGSYKRKRNTWHSIDLNAYVGGFVGHEFQSSFTRSNPSPKSIEVKNGWNYGLSAPIGFTYSFNTGRKISYSRKLSTHYLNNPDLVKIKLNNNRVKVIDRTRSFNISLSIFDIGAAVSYRFNYSGQVILKDSTGMSLADTNPILSNKVRWEQFFSPGVHFSWGIRNTPIVWRMGIQYTPSIRRFKDGSGVELYQNMFRVYTGLYFDLPVYNVWRKSSIAKY